MHYIERGLIFFIKIVSTTWTWKWNHTIIMTRLVNPEKQLMVHCNHHHHHEKSFQRSCGHHLSSSVSLSCVNWWQSAPKYLQVLVHLHHHLPAVLQHNIHKSPVCLHHIANFLTDQSFISEILLCFVLFHGFLFYLGSHKFYSLILIWYGRSHMVRGILSFASRIFTFILFLKGRICC